MDSVVDKLTQPGEIDIDGILNENQLKIEDKFSMTPYLNDINEYFDQPEIIDIINE